MGSAPTLPSPDVALLPQPHPPAGPDVAGEVQLFGEMADGDRHVLGGEPPYSLVIGNASAVTMTVGGTPFDVRAIAKGNVARFELDPADIVAAPAGVGGSAGPSDD